MNDKQKPSANERLWVLFWSLPAAQQLAVLAAAISCFVLGASAAYLLRTYQVDKAVADLAKKDIEIAQLKSDTTSSNSTGKAEVPASENPTFKKLLNLSADYLEESLANTRRKFSIAQQDNATDESEIQYRRLRRAIFFNCWSFQADKAILTESLALLDARGYSFIADHKARLLSEFDKIKQLRLRWLEDSAIRELALEQEKMRQSPAQSAPSAWVLIPKELKVLPDDNEKPGVSVSDMLLLKREAKLIKESL